MESGPGIDSNVFDPTVLAKVQRLIPAERLDEYLRDLEREHFVLANCAVSETSLKSRAHKITSQAGMLGLNRMSACARALEAACGSGVGMAKAQNLCRAAGGDVRLYAMPAALLSTA